MGGRGRPEHSCIISFETSPALFGTVQLLYDQVIIYPVRPVSSPVQPLLYWCWPRSARHLTRPLNQSGTLDIFLVAFSLYFEIKGWQCFLHGIGTISETIAFINFKVHGNQWKHLKGWCCKAREWSVVYCTSKPQPFVPVCSIHMQPLTSQPLWLIFLLKSVQTTLKLPHT